ncbi:hypothetical protein NDI52_11780 [Leptolyngbya sp. PL-A3]|uniref:hypothetical protein n=1 Tax=Leptolyngbya sp. PL-A3 TaxID=2933911 RepID=UPI00329A57D9
MQTDGYLRQIEHRIDALRKLPLEPGEYCRRWVSQDDSRGYRKSCIHAIATATGLSPSTVKDWGPDFVRCPRYVPYLLRQADLLNQFKQLALNKQISLPPDFPQE